MLSMANVASVASAASYYAEDNYYSKEENTAMSTWAGKGAEALDLAGPVDPADFVKVLSGEIGGVELGRVIGTGPDGEKLRDHRPGTDVTLSAPKSVSMLAEVAGRADVRGAHEAAVSKVLAYMEANFAQARVTEKGVTQFVKTDNLLVGRFHHTTSRELDPQTHTHLVIANATRLEDGRWMSLDNSLLFKNQQLLGAIYDSELAANLRDLGYRLESTANGRWEVAGIDREQIEHFSQRSKAIEERLEKFGLSRATASAGQREDAALRTRDSKKEVDHAALREDWRERAKSVGVNFDKIIQDKENGAAPPTGRDVIDAKAEDAVRFAIAHLTERESVVARAEVIQVALQHAAKDAPWASVRLEDVNQQLDGKLASSEALVTAKGDVTTPEALQRERAMLTMLEEGRGAVAPITTQQSVDAAVARFEATRSAEAGVEFKLTFGQLEAARANLTSEDRFVGNQGYAGVGKTTMMELVRIVAEESGYTVRGMAPSAQAAQTLQNETGIESVTTARFLLDEGQRAVSEAKPKPILLEVFGAVDLGGKDWRSVSVELPQSARTQYGAKELWVMDEASLSGQREMTQLMELANKAGARLVLMGDHLQLNAVEAGKPFELLQKAGIDVATMSDINRQQVEDLKRAVASAVVRENAQALKHLNDRITEIPDRGELLGRVASDILAKHPQDRDKALIIVPLNEDRHDINKQVREGLQQRGEIGESETKRSMLIPTGFTDAQKQSTAYYQEKMVVRFGRDYRSLGAARGEYGKVISVDRPGHQVRLQMENGRTVTFSPEKNSKVEVYKVEERELGIGDELRFTRNNKDMGVTNGTLAKVAEIHPDRVVLDTVKGSIELKAQNRSHEHWDYAYAMTVYASQGRTTNDVNFLITQDSGRAMGERSFYVGITRPRLDMTIYTDDKGKAQSLIDEAQNKTSAVEQINYKEILTGPKRDDEGSTKPAKGGGGSGRSTGAEL